MARWRPCPTATTPSTHAGGHAGGSSRRRPQAPRAAHGRLHLAYRLPRGRGRMSAQAVPRRLPRSAASAALVAACVLAAACGDDDPAGSAAPEGLPTKQFQLGYDLSPTAREAKSAQARRTRATARRELERLIDAYRDDAEATVRTSFEPSNEPGPQFEDLTIRQTGPAAAAGCRRSRGGGGRHGAPMRTISASTPPSAAACVTGGGLRLGR